MDLSILSGNIGKDRAGFLPLIKECNFQGALDMGIAPDLLPGQISINNKKHSKKLMTVPDNFLHSQSIPQWIMVVFPGNHGRLNPEI